MLKQMIVAAGLSALAFSTAPVSAQDSGKCEAAAGHVKVFDGKTGQLSASGGGSASGGVRVAAGDVNGDGATSGHIKKATLFGRKAGDDKRSDGEVAPARMKSQNNLKQIGLANNCN